MGTTARDIIKASLRKIGAIATGETPAAEELNDALFELNLMLSSWSTENLSIPVVTRELLTLTGGINAYAIGTGLTLDTPKPTHIQNICAIASGYEQSPMRKLSPDEWAALSDKNSQSDFPTDYYIQNTGVGITLNVYPTPISAIQVAVYSKKALSKITNVSAELTLPEGYDDALVYNLAVRLAPEFGKMASQEVIKFASESKTNIKRKNIEPVYATIEIGTNNRSFNIYTGR